MQPWDLPYLLPAFRARPAHAPRPRPALSDGTRGVLIESEAVALTHTRSSTPTAAAATDTGSDAGNVAGVTGCGRGAGGDVCLLRCDPWPGGVAVALACDGPRLRLRRARLDRGRLNGGDARPRLRRTQADSGCSSSGGRGVVVHDVDALSGEDDLDSELAEVYSTRWSLAGSLALSAGATTAAPVLRLGRVGGEEEGLGGGGGAVAALAAQHLFLVDTATDQPRAVARVRFDLPLSVRATTMDGFGSHGTLVGFSDGQLRLYDWRESGGGGGGGGEADGDEQGSRPSLALPAVPQPHWLLPVGSAAATRRRRRGGGAPATTSDGTSAGILSCCALGEAGRVACGLADSRGAVVVADLRMGTSSRSGGSSSRSHGGSAAAVVGTTTTVPDLLRTDRVLAGPRCRLTAREAAVRDLLQGHRTTATGAAITEMRGCGGRLGLVGMVDLHGRPMLTTFAALEREAEAEASCGASPTLAALAGLGDGAENDDDDGEGGRTRARRDALPSPWEVTRRLTAGYGAGGSVGSGRPHNAPPPQQQQQQPAPSYRSLCYRCAFARYGDVFLHTHRIDTGGPHVPVAASFIGTGRGGQTSEASWQTVTTPGGEGAGVDSGSIVALSTLGEAVCLETSDGTSLCLFLED